MRMTFTRRLPAILLVLLALHCSDGPGPATVSVSVDPSTVSLVAGGVQAFTATVTNDAGARGVTWAITGCTAGTAACGSLSNVTGTTATYTAPTPVPSDTHLGISATSVADNAKSDTATATIAAIAISLSPASANVAVNAPRPFTAVVANDPTNSGVTWSITGCSGGAAACGSLSNVSSTTATYTTPATVPLRALGVTATSVSDNTKAFTATVTVIAIGAGGQIAFVSTRDGNSEIYVMNVDGSSQVNLTNNSGSDVSPAWSPDGTRIAFVSDRDGNYEIYVMNADGSGQVNLSNNRGDDDDPAWSADGSKIAFVSTRNGNAEIYVMNADGSGQVNLTHNPETDFSPAWSPDGSKIAFVSTRNGTYEIYVMNADGSRQVSLTNNPGEDYSPTPVWSPGGSKIAFPTYRDANWEIYVMNADGSSPVNLTINPGEDYDPQWSHDGLRIVFRSEGVAAINADGTGFTRLIANSSCGFSCRFSFSDPVWSPTGDRIAVVWDSVAYTPHCMSSPCSRLIASGISVLNPDGSGLVTLVDTPGVSTSSPAWSPR